jgi:hypothetical protein
MYGTLSFRFLSFMQQPFSSLLQTHSSLSKVRLARAASNQEQAGKGHA